MKIYRSVIWGLGLCCALTSVVTCGDDTGSGAGGGDPACGDDLFCNGVERLVEGECVKVPANPCDDRQDCTEDLCDEATDTCSHTLGADCASCAAGEDCVPDCAGKQCGDNGCGATCGACDAGDGCASITGECAPADQLGSCATPRDLTITEGQQVLSGDTTMGLHQATPTCNSTSTAVEDIYTFTLTEEMGLDVRTHDFDTVVHIRSTCLDDTPEATLACSDDASPPGDYGSRVSVLLQPGTYFLIVDGFDSTSYGPYTLDIRAVPGCAPQCSGVYCDGDDSCGGTCGDCPPDFACGADFRCRPDPCTPDCTNDGTERGAFIELADASARVCGDDGCLGSCGQCAGGALCVPTSGQCETFPGCDHFAPICDPGCGTGSFCGSDCACHAVDALMPDLVMNAERLANEILFDEVEVNANSCAVIEGCVGGLGTRQVLRFSVEAINQGQATLTVPAPEDHPELFHLSPCHGHFHFDGFAQYELLDAEGEVVIDGSKQAYCMEDTEQVLLGPDIACDKVHDCSFQGIEPGWSDLYGNALDCQWLDITGVSPGEYQIRVTLNPNRAFEEISFDNNVATVPVTIE